MMGHWHNGLVFSSYNSLTDVNMIWWWDTKMQTHQPERTTTHTYTHKKKITRKYFLGFFFPAYISSKQICQTNSIICCCVLSNFLLMIQCQFRLLITAIAGKKRERKRKTRRYSLVHLYDVKWFLHTYTETYEKI